ncbi:hypothetical protein Leryth_025034 [Lithospermum erythrorhizon]|nr:hypothetical protein Leryth_025034 [Lithospermum erythrorhizon]
MLTRFLFLYMFYLCFLVCFLNYTWMILNYVICIFLDNIF